MKFYFLDENLYKRGYIRIAIKSNIPLKDIRKIKFGNTEIYNEIIYKIYIGRKISNILWTTGANFYFSETIVNLLKDNGITGWKTFPITIDDKKNLLLERYFGLITEKTDLDQFYKRDSQIKIITPNGREVICQKGTYIDIEKWNGNDIFALSNGRFVFSEKVVNSLSNIDYPNSYFVETSEELTEIVVLENTKNIKWID